MRYQLYRHYDANNLLLYVGISNSFLQRTISHGHNSEWFNQIVRIEVAHFATKHLAIVAEMNAIKSEKPVFNRFGVSSDGDAITEMTVAAVRSKLISLQGTMSIRTFAKEIGCSHANLAYVIGGKRDPGPKILQYLSINKKRRKPVCVRKEVRYEWISDAARIKHEKEVAEIRAGRY